MITSHINTPCIPANDNYLTRYGGYNVGGGYTVYTLAGPISFDDERAALMYVWKNQ